jgi:hypothetical protein
MLLGVPVMVSEFAPNTLTTGSYVGLIGDPSFYWIADALTVQVQRIDELYAETNQVGFMGRLFDRRDASLRRSLRARHAGLSGPRGKGWKISTGSELKTGWAA